MAFVLRGDNQIIKNSHTDTLAENSNTERIRIGIGTARRQALCAHKADYIGIRHAGGRADGRAPD